jgi:hypothetical protein
MSHPTIPVRVRANIEAAVTTMRVSQREYSCSN